ncbi:MAG: hypothetical protein VX114_03515 [Chloroflexota bacterium]|nr:hypothetical protein [Chloroflexota bacterium]|tara:strand:+ start:113 stop:340 length:228 start_codon:yes stop_codon:yes gene_type:complete
MEINNEIQLYILKLLSEQFMYKDEIVENCLNQFKKNLKTTNPTLTIKNQLKELSDNKMVAYYHGYKITEKGKKLV